MHEGRSATVRLLDGECLEISVIARLSVNDVLTLAAHHCRLQQSDARYFGLAFVDNNDHYHWLQPGKHLLDYEFPGDKAVIQLTHNVRFFVDSIVSLENPAVIEAFFLEAHQQFVKGQLDLSNIDYVRVGGLLLQIYRGDWSDDPSVLNDMDSLVPYHSRLLRQYGLNKTSFEKQVLMEYARLRGIQRGSAIVSFMQIVEQCSKYGSRLYRVCEGGGSPCLLSINSRGIQLYENMDTFRPKDSFSWSLLDNLCYKDSTFSIEVRDPRSKQIPDLNAYGGTLVTDDDLAQAVSDPTTKVSISRRCQQSIPAGICVHTFVCESGLLCRTIWITAISQHQFFLDQKEREQRGRPAGSAVDHRELGERLNRLVSKSSIGSSLPSLSSLHSSSSLNTMPSAKVADGSCANLPTLKNGLRQKSGEDRQRDIELYKVLRGRKAELEELLRTRINELRSICLREGEITGEMPEEIKTTLRPGEEMPKLKKRVGTSFSIPEEILKCDKADKISQLETDVELHKKIVAAAERLAKDKTMNKSVRKKRQKDLAAAAMKLRGLELGLNQMRLSASKPDVSSLESNGSGGSWTPYPQTNGNPALTRAVAKSCPTTPRGSVPDLCPSNGEKSDYEDDEQVQRRAPSSMSRRSLHQRFSEASTSSNGSLGLPPRANSRRSVATRSITSDELDNPLINSVPVPEQAPIYENIGYRSTSYRSSYRQAHYPTLQDEQHLRKRALSAHSISQTDVPNSVGYSTRIENTSFQFKQTAKSHIPEDDDLTPTVEHPEPLRRLPTSFSCQAGFSTASLDRRAIVQRPSPSAANGAVASTRHAQQFSISPSRGHSPNAHRITTFPVCSPLTGGFDRKPFSSSDLPRFPAMTNRPGLVQFASHGYQLSRGVPASSSAGKLPAHADPHMEALLDYYKGQSNQSASPKTATIV